MKLIAIKPLDGCHKDYLKVLNKDTLYQFYKNYEISAINKVTINSSLPEDFFYSGKTKINVCAIVGKNGSGKSSIIELLFRAINNLAYKLQVPGANLSHIKALNVEIFFETEKRIFRLRMVGDKINFFGINPSTNRLTKPINNFHLKDFFYTVAVNFSHYAYNSRDFQDEGPWIEGLFHKNDGYQTPLVLNPLRDEGIIDINNENHLIKSRLIANLARSSHDNHNNFRDVNDEFRAHHLNLKIYKSQSKRVIYTEQIQGTNEEKAITLDDIFSVAQRNEILKKVDRHYFFGYKKINKTVYKEALDYIVYKLLTIATRYFNHSRIVFIQDLNSGSSDVLDGFLEELKDDRTHVTLKLRQTINFLKFQHIEIDKEVLSFDELANAINKVLSKRLTYRLEREELIPPPIFETDISLERKDKKGAFVNFKKLSSGEKQMIYSTSAMLYHLVNIDSIPNNSKRKIAYRNVNFILEEIELYAHPEMQQKYLSFILNSINNLQLKRTHSINFCFVTHSPFILTDIPHSNVLFLNQDGSPILNSDLRTFGGNIHELLANSFFLGNGTIGNFAKEKIEKIISLLKPNNRLNIDKASLEYQIKMIAEPFLRMKLLEMYNTKFGSLNRIEELEAEIKFLKNGKTNS